MARNPSHWPRRHGELWGDRESKNQALWAGTISQSISAILSQNAPDYPFVPRNQALAVSYLSSFSIADLMPASVTGIVTAKDGLVVDFTKTGLQDRIERFCDFQRSDSEIRSEFFPRKNSGKYLPGDSRGWRLAEARKSLQKLIDAQTSSKLLIALSIPAISCIARIWWTGAALIS